MSKQKPGKIYAHDVIVKDVNTMSYDEITTWRIYVDGNFNDKVTAFYLVEDTATIVVISLPDDLTYETAHDRVVEAYLVESYDRQSHRIFCKQIIKVEYEEVKPKITNAILNLEL
jgi:hypothetical protein